MTDTKRPSELDRVLDAAVAAAPVLRDRAPAERAGTSAPPPTRWMRPPTG